MSVMTGKPASESRPVLCVLTAVWHGRAEGLGIGLVQRVACEKTGRTNNDVLQTAERGLKLTREEFAATKKNPRDRADLLALLEALHMAADTVNVRLPTTVEPIVVVVLLGRPCQPYRARTQHLQEHNRQQPLHCCKDSLKDSLNKELWIQSVYRHVGSSQYKDTADGGKEG